MSKETIKNSTKPIKVLHLDTAKEPSPRTFLSFVRNLKRFRRKKTKPRGFARNLQNLLQNPGVWFVLYETFLGFVRNLKRFRGEGSFAVSR